jgi:hypothetical protein
MLKAQDLRFEKSDIIVANIAPRISVQNSNFPNLTDLRFNTLDPKM